MEKLHKLDEHIIAITKIFKTTDNKYEAHLRCNPILYKMAADEEVIFEVLRRNMRKPKFFSKKLCTPDFPLWLAEEPEFSLHAFFFGPNQEKRTDVTYSTMHHHDDFLLSTINAKGPGYKSLIFQPGYEIDTDKMEAKIELEKYSLHAPNHIEFITSHTAHVLFYPDAPTLTYGLWSTHYPTSRVTKLKNSEFVKKNKEKLKNLVDKMKLNLRKVGVQQYREDYFFPENGTLKFLSGQIDPPQGKHFIQNFFHHAKEFIGFNDTNFLKKLYSELNKSNQGENNSLSWIERAIEKETIERNYESYQMYTPKRNVPIEEYRKLYEF